MPVDIASVMGHPHQADEFGLLSGSYVLEMGPERVAQRIQDRDLRGAGVDPIMPPRPMFEQQTNPELLGRNVPASTPFVHRSVGRWQTVPFPPTRP